MRPPCADKHSTSSHRHHMITEGPCTSKRDFLPSGTTHQSCFRASGTGFSTIRSGLLVATLLLKQRPPRCEQAHHLITPASYADRVTLRTKARYHGRRHRGAIVFRASESGCYRSFICDLHWRYLCLNGDHRDANKRIT